MERAEERREDAENTKQMRCGVSWDMKSVETTMVLGTWQMHVHSGLAPLECCCVGMPDSVSNEQEIVAP